MNRISGRNLAGDTGVRGRVKNDYYATPSYATKQFLDVHKFENVKNILEPACGEGHMSKVIEKEFLDSSITSSDLIDRGYGVSGIDFLTEEFEMFDLVITNPPFKYAKEFIEKGLEISNRYVVMFAKLQLLESKSRYDLFMKHPPSHVYAHSSRVNPLRNGSEVDENGKKWSSTMAFAWFVWDKENKNETIVRWLK